MIIPPNSAGLQAPRRLEEPSSPQAKAPVMDLLRSLVIVEKLSALVGATTPFPIDQALDNFWEGMMDDCAYRTGPALARHNYQRDLGHLEHQGHQLMRELEAMPAGAQRTDAREKLESFLDEQRTQIEARYQREASDKPQTPFARGSLRPMAYLDTPPPLGSETP